MKDEFEQLARGQPPARRGRLVDILAKAVLAFDRRHTTYIPAAVPLGQPFGEINDNLAVAVEDESGEGELERVGGKGRARGRRDGKERMLTSLWQRLEQKENPAQRTAPHLPGKGGEGIDRAV